MKCAITGANGYVGSRIKRVLESSGWDVLELGRRPGAGSGFFAPYSLGDSLDPAVFRGVEALVHCAYDFGPLRWREIRSTNVEGSRRLFASAVWAEVRKIVYISSISAFEGCSSLYGRAKLETEAEVIKLGGIAIRPGLVFGDAPGGMMGSLARIIQKSTVVPVVGKNQRMFLCHEEDLARLVYKAVSGELNGVQKPLIAASSSGRTFGEILQGLGRRQGREITLVPVSWRLAWAGLKLAEGLGLAVGLRSDSLMSLMNPVPDPDFASSRRLDLNFRDFTVV